MLDVTRLRVLVAVARHGSVTAAARALNYAQPSVSHHLSRLEAETGALLTQRAGRGVRLTDAGRLLAERAEEILGRLDAAENELAAHVGLRAGRVRLAAFPSALSTLVPMAAARLEAENPGVDLTLAEAEPPEALRMLRAGYVDVALVFRHYQDGATVSPSGDSDEGTRSRLLLDDPIHLVTRAAGGADGRTPHAAGEPPLPPWPDLADYAEYRWIGGLRAVPRLPGLAVRAGRVQPEDLVHHRRLRGGPGARGRGPGHHDAPRPGAPGRAAPGHPGRAAARVAPAGARRDLR